MKKYTYNLFPIPVLIIGYSLMVIAAGYISVSIFIMKTWNFPAPVVVMIIGLIFVSFRSEISVDDNFNYIIKESRLSGMSLSREKIKIPHNCDIILIRQKIKKGTGYYRFILPVTYSFKSFDMFLCSGSGEARLINTDYSRALKIAGFFQSEFNIRNKFE